MVDNGCTVLDVVIEHAVYGQLTGELRLTSRHDVAQFIGGSWRSRHPPLPADGRHPPAHAPLPQRRGLRAHRARTGRRRDIVCQELI